MAGTARQTVRGQGDVNLLGDERLLFLCRRELLLPLGERLLHAALALTDQLASCGTLILGQILDPGVGGGDHAAVAHMLDTNVLQRSGIGRGSDGGQCLLNCRGDRLLVDRRRGLGCLGHDARFRPVAVWGAGARPGRGAGTANHSRRTVRQISDQSI